MQSPINTTSVSAASSSVQQSPTTSSLPMAAPPAPSTDALLKDFSLVAEAAKRAQVAIMVRDFESVEL